MELIIYSYASLKAELKTAKRAGIMSPALEKLTFYKTKIH